MDGAMITVAMCNYHDSPRRIRYLATDWFFKIPALADWVRKTGQVRATPTWALRLAGLVVPAARETVEMRYEFEEDFVVDDSAFRAAFGLAATPLDEALADTVAWWRAHEARG